MTPGGKAVALSLCPLDAQVIQIDAAAKLGDTFTCVVKRWEQERPRVYVCASLLVATAPAVELLLSGSLDLQPALN